MADLLKRLVKQNVAMGYVGQILSAFSEDEHPHHPISPSPSLSISQPLVEPLTNREFEILDLLTHRLSTKEIAARLFIAPATVKKHLGNIYGKLNVGKRREAVEKAKRIGIL